LIPAHNDHSVLDQINQAAEDNEKGITIKPLVRLGSYRQNIVFETAGESALRCRCVLQRSRAY
jgi:hypothetical protein